MLLGTREAFILKFCLKPLDYYGGTMTDIYFTKELISQIAKEELELVHKYADGYAELKALADTSAEYDVVWAEGMAEPYYIGYINDIEKMPQRKVFLREPKNKMFAAKHCFKNGKPVYSVFLNEKGECAAEKFFSEQGNMRVGTMFHGRKLHGVSSEVFDDDGKPVYYRYIEIKKNIGTPEQIISKCFVYGHEDGCITSAQCIDSFDITKEITLYDEPIYNDWLNRSVEYKLSVSPMNPNSVCEYRFIYGEKGYPLEFSRTEYKYCNVSTGQWKASKKTFEQFEKLGVKWFVK